MSDHVAKYLTRLKSDPMFFIDQIWKIQKLDEYADLGWVERDIIDWIINGPKQRGALAPRGFGKTTFGTCAYTAYRLFENPETRIRVISKSRGKAREFISQIRTWINTTPFMSHLRPRTPTADLQWTDNVDQFDVGCITPTKDPSVAALGIESQLEGGRAHIVIADDVETRENTQTVEAREDLAARVDEFTSMSTFGGREVIYFGTFHHEESLYLKESEKDVAFRTWPLVYPSPKDEQLNLAPSIVRKLEEGARSGDIVADYRIDQEYVNERLARGRTYFAMQQQLICNLGDTARYPLQLSDLIVFPCNPTKAPLSIAWGRTNNSNQTTRLTDLSHYGFQGDGLYSPIMFDEQWEDYSAVKMWIDPAGKGKDKTGYAIVAHLNGWLYTLAVGGLTGGYDPATLDTLADLAMRHGVREVFVEDNFGQGMFQPLFEPVLTKKFTGPCDDHPHGWGASVETIRVSGQKEVRIIDNLEPVMNQHRLVIDLSVAKNEALQRQLTRITRQRQSLEHDDELEALAMCVSRWQYVLHQDPEVAAENNRQRYIDEQIEEFQRWSGGKNPSKSGWVQRI